MSESRYPKKGKILMLGEGDFSFTTSLLRFVDDPSCVVATCIETKDTITKKHRNAASNIIDLRSKGVTVLYAIDATRLVKYHTLKDQQFSYIIFNFPHVGGKASIGQNRKLLKQLFCSCVDVLHDDGEVHITLCKGQGGTPADKPARHWPNSWQVVAMAAYADLILTKAIPFDISDYPEYSSTGFRSQDKSFFTTNSLVHVFLKRLAIPTEPVQREFIQAVINGLNMEFNCPPCFAEYIHRNLFKQEMHPIVLVRDAMMNHVREKYGDDINVIDPSLADIIVQDNGERNAFRLPTANHCDPASGELGMVKSETDNIASQDVLCDVKLSKAGTDKEENNYTEFESRARDNGDKDLANCRESQLSIEAIHAPGCDDASAAVDDASAAVNDASAAVDDASASVKNLTDVQAAEATLNESETGAGREGMVTVKLQESFDRLSISVNKMPHIGEKQETEMLTSTKVAEDASNQRSDYILRPTLDCSYNLMQSSELGPHPKISVLWGRTFSHCLIKPEKFPIRHELVSVFPKQYVITDALPNLELLRSLLPEKNFEIELRQISNEGQRTSGVPESWLLIEDNAVSRNSHIIVVRSKNTEMKHTVGYARTLDNATMFSYNLDVLAMLIFDVSDVRLLWSDDPRLWQQFTALVDFKCGNQLNLQSILYNDITFKSFSIYPPAYIHDISIWERSNETRLSESEFFSLMREITHHQILNVYLKDQYVHPKTGSKSRCYRMVHQSPDKALSKCKATELQIQLRAALRDRFGIYVR